MNAEVCVIGGGPGGAAFAARLAGLGHDIVVVEREPFPRPHIGEALSPAIWPLLDGLDVTARVAAAGFEPVAQSRVLWRAREERVTEPGDGLTVDRGRFDAILLDRARAAGAAVLTATARRPIACGDGTAPAIRGGRWEVPLAGGGVVRARMLADASGRRRVLGGRRTATSPRTLALHALWRTPCVSDGTPTLIEALADGWLWGAHLGSGRFRAMAFVDPQSRAGAGPHRGRRYRGLLAGSTLFADLLRSGSPASRVWACDATSYETGVPIDEHAVKIGEAAFAIDPLSSSGVQTAIQTGIAAATAVHTILAPDGDSDAAVAFYCDHQRHSVQRHAATAAAVYAEHASHRERDFWRARAARPPAPAHGAATVNRRAIPSLAELLPRRVRLSPAATLVDTPSLVGDWVEFRRALVHPGLERPVAFLGGSELAPLLDALPSSDSLSGAMSRWQQTGLAPGRARDIAHWLHSRQLIELAP